MTVHLNVVDFMHFLDTVLPVSSLVILKVTVLKQQQHEPSETSCVTLGLFLNENIFTNIYYQDIDFSAFKILKDFIKHSLF